MKTITITGMSCGHCSARVQKALLALPGTVKADVSHETGMAVYEGSASDADIVKAVADAGYDVTNIA